MGGINGHGKFKMASASTSITNDPAKHLILVHTVQLITNDKSTFLRNNGNSGISDVAFASVYIEKTRLKTFMKMMIMIIIIIMNKSKEMMVFSGHQKLTPTMKLRPEK